MGLLYGKTSGKGAIISKLLHKWGFELLGALATNSVRYMNSIRYVEGELGSIMAERGVDSNVTADSSTFLKYFLLQFNNGLSKHIDVIFPKQIKPVVPKYKVIHGNRSYVNM